jgi:hypothetical protein
VYAALVTPDGWKAILQAHICQNERPNVHTDSVTNLLCTVPPQVVVLPIAPARVRPHALRSRVDASFGYRRESRKVVPHIALS